MTEINGAPLFIPRLAQPTANLVQDEALWEASIQAYGDGDYVRSLAHLVRYLDPDKLPEGDDIVGRTIVLEHGSVRIHFSVTDERLSLRVPFLRLPQGGRAIALMRKSLEVSTDLNLSGFRLEDEALVIRYGDKLAGCHPAKLLDIMACICRVVDSYDDLFCQQFGAELAEPNPVERWSDAQLDDADRAFRQILSNGLNLAAHWESKQNLRYAFYSLDMSMDRLTWVLAVQGFVRSELIRIYNQLTNEQRAYAQRVSDARKSLGKLADLSKDELSESLYNARFIIPELREYDLGAYQNAIRDVMETATAMGHDRKYDLAVTVYLHNTYEDLGRYRLPDGVRKIYTDAMQAAGGQPWREAAEILTRGYQAAVDYKETTGDLPRADDYYRDAMASMQPHLTPQSELSSEEL